MKAALYVRVSTEAQKEEGYSIEAQKEALIGYCKAKGIKQYELYVDGGFSGSSLDRPQIRRLMEDARAGRLSHCIVYKLDRLSRSQKDTLYLIEDVFNPCRIDFISINETIDTGTPMGRLMIGILSAFAQLERENIRERTRMGMLERVKEGYWMGGGKVPFGYDYDSAKGILVPNQDAQTVRQCYELYLEGLSPQAIANLTGLKYGSLVTSILRRKSNTGVIVFRGKEYPGRHTPIIDSGTYLIAMERMRERSSSPITSSANLLTGLMVCGRCGARMHYQSWGKKGHKIGCYSRQTSKPYLVRDPNCTQPYFWKEEIESLVIQDIFQFVLKQQKEAASPKTDLTASLKSRLEETKNRLKRLYRLYASDDNPMLLETIEETQKEYDVLNQQIQLRSQQQSRLAASRKLSQKISHLSQVWDLLSPSEQKNIVHILVEKIVINGRQIEIHYRI